MSENVRVELSPKQQRALVALLSHATIAAAATDAGISERTLRRWLSEAAFQVALRAAEGGAIDEATRQLIALQARAISTIDTIMADPATPPAVRLRAAQVALETMSQLRELRNTEQRIAALERAVAQQERGPHGRED